ncbi:MAG: HAD family hydrolase [Chloroflexota bacterium]|nr:MAG: HAD family hydrolase [Chloroflexota bacterium]
MIDIIAFDADDTLWHNEHLYYQAKKTLPKILVNYGEVDAIRTSLDKTEVENIEYYGYGIKSFALSMIEVAVDISQGQVTGNEIREIITVAKNMLKAPVELVPDAADTLKDLSGKYDLMLITKGDLFEQERKIGISKISNCFRHLEVVGEKSDAAYRNILKKYNIKPADFLMVGNSLRSDILPVLRVGGQAVYIPNEHTWFHEHADEDEVGDFKFVELERLSLLPEYVRQLK